MKFPRPVLILDLFASDEFKIQNERPIKSYEIRSAKTHNLEEEGAKI